MRDEVRAVTASAAWNAAGLALLALLALGIGLVGIGSRSIWYDESVSVFIASRPLAELNEFFWTDSRSAPLGSNMMGYHLPLHFWLKLGTSETLVRLPSALASALAVPIVYLIGRRLVGRPAAILAAMLLAAHALRVEYAQEARAYGLLLLMSVAATYAHLRAREPGGRLAWVAAYVVLAATTAYVHILGVVVVAAHAASLLVWRPQSYRRGLLPFVMVALLCTPLLVATLIQSGRFGGPGTLSVDRVLSVTHSLAGGGAFLAGVPLTLAVLVLSVLGSVTVYRRWRDTKGEDALLLGWLGVTLLGLLIISLFRDVVSSRYFLVAVPPLLLLASQGVMSLAGSWQKALVAALLLVLVADGLVHWYGRYDRHPDSRAAAAFVEPRWQRGDGFLFFRTWTWRPFEFYHDRAGPKRVRATPDNAESRLARRSNSFQRIWFVVSHAGYDPPDAAVTTLQDALERRYDHVDTWTFTRIQVQLYVRERASD